jgi:hypothetical protein
VAATPTWGHSSSLSVQGSRALVALALLDVGCARTLGSELVSILDSMGIKVKQRYRSETKSIAPEQIEALITTLGRRVQLLDSDIEAEEQRTQCKDRCDASYSVLARTLIARHDNLSATIAALQERMATSEAPEWNYS